MKTVTLIFLCLCLVSISHQIAEQCQTSRCKIEDNCRCSKKGSPLPLADTPQLISLTFEEAIVDNLFNDLWKPLLFNRKNPDGNHISGTFFVPHEYTDYSDVQTLYLQGFEIGVNSITKNSLISYWANATEQTLIDEFYGQREIISRFANININDIVGAQVPQLEMEGDVLINAYIKSGIQYDNSWTSRSSQPLYPYTLDYLSTQECRSDTLCPVQSHPGFWIFPINNIQGNNSIECNALTNCQIHGTANYIATWLLEQVNRVRLSSKEPISLLIPSSWFRFIHNTYAGFEKFLDTLATYEDVFLVNQKQILDWLKNPVPLSNFTTDVPQRSAVCYKINCALYTYNSQIRYMTSCVPCPAVYPWLGNPYGELEIIT